MVFVDVGNRTTGDVEMTITTLGALYKLAAQLATKVPDGGVAQELRQCIDDARRYRFLRDYATPESCKFYIASDDPQANFKALDSGIDADEAQYHAKRIATKA